MAGFLSTKMKRKDLDEVYDEFSEFSLNSPARKIRRLDAELPPIMEEEDPAVPLSFQQQMPQGPVSSGIPESGMLGSAMVDNEPFLLSNENRALVLYKPVDHPFVLSPNSSNVSFRVNSDVIDGLKNQTFWPRNPKVEELPMDNKQANNSLAVIPWVAASQARLTDYNVEEPMEAEEESGDMLMEVEESEQCSSNGVGENVHQWQQQQHCLVPELLRNSTPITWSWG